MSELSAAGSENYQDQDNDIPDVGPSLEYNKTYGGG